MKDLTPREIVGELDKYIVGQAEAKKSVAIALRNRWRRQQVAADLKEEISPKNIIMIGSTGVGKTEIARRLAKLAHAPFLKVEATKFTEVGYVGKDVESMIRDLMELSINLVKERERERVIEKAKANAEERLLDLMLPSGAHASPVRSPLMPPSDATGDTGTREKLRQMLCDGRLDDRVVELETRDRAMPILEVMSGSGMEDMDINLKDMFSNIFPKQVRHRKIKVPEALEALTQEEVQKLIDMDAVIKLAKEKTEQSGIIFLDEIDKVVAVGRAQGPDVSREGVQRDILPIVEGSTVTTKHGMIRTDHILFIAAGAFHNCKPSDLLPELQGRFPIRVELDNLTREDFVRILREPQNSLTKQYRALMETEKVYVEFDESAIEKVAEVASVVNERTEKIGSRRLYTIMEKVFEEISFHAPDMQEQSVKIDDAFVDRQLSAVVKDEDMSRYIL